MTYVISTELNEIPLTKHETSFVADNLITVKYSRPIRNTDWVRPVLRCFENFYQRNKSNV